MFPQINLMKQKAFTLIELLVVVAIIGILAAVGVNTFSGFQEKAKISATKANLTIIKKYITFELTKCELGETIVMDGNLNCADITKGGVDLKAYRALKNVIKDPYGSVNGGVGYGYFSGNNCVVGMLGRTSIYGHHTTHELKLYTCLKLNEPIVITTLTLY